MKLKNKHSNLQDLEFEQKKEKNPKKVPALSKPKLLPHISSIQAARIISCASFVPKVLTPWLLHREKEGSNLGLSK